jgi:2-(3-amino-3-carboxypropyl)histidine synthase
MLDPYLTIAEDVTPLAEKWLKRSILQLYNARDAERFGVIIGLREGQNLFKRAMQIRSKLLEYGKVVQPITLREITDERLVIFKNIDAFVQTACPRISIDGETFSKPILSIPQIEALFNIWDGKEPEVFLEKPLWL